MENSAQYKTKQRTALHNAIAASDGRHITVDGLTAALEADGNAVGRTTVYRYLEKLAREGAVRKYTHAGESTCYQYVGEHGCREHFHLKCESCGRLIHIECDYFDTLGEHIADSHGFKVNRLKTVLYGICKDCDGK